MNGHHATDIVLRRMIGLAGTLLPVALVVGGWMSSPRIPFLPSMSAYYYTDMRSLFVLILFALGVFLICAHRGCTEDRVTNLAGGLIIAVSLIPTRCSLDIATVCQGGAAWWLTLTGHTHLLSAGIFLALTGWICRAHFSRSDPDRARLYKTMGLVIWTVLGLAVVSRLWLAGLALGPISTHGIWLTEFLTVSAFGVAWLASARSPRPLDSRP